MSLYVIPFILQAILMTVDEFFREKKGNSIEQVTILFTFFVPAFFKYDSFNALMFIFIAILCGLFTLKNYFTNSDSYSRIKQWLHLFITLLQPITFAIAYYLWSNNGNLLILKFQISLIFVFVLYQVLSWSGPWQRFQK